MLRKWLSKLRRQPLEGAPAIRRLKTYSARNGFIYHYFFEGHRPLSERRQPGVEFVFTVSTDRKRWHGVAVVLRDHSIGDWEKSHARALSWTERYAIAKMALFQAFDERPRPADMDEDVIVRPADISAILETLDL